LVLASFIYYLTIFYAFSVSALMHFGMKEFRVIDQVFLLSPIIFVYLFFMSRSGGVDIVNYIYAYEVDPSNIPDVLFQSYYIFLNLMNFPFFVSNLLIGILNSFVLVFFVSKFFPRYTFLNFLIFFTHLMVVRDFAQLRISFAFSFFILGIMNKNFLKYFFIFLSFGIHKSLVVLALVYFFAEFFIRQSLKVKIILFICFVITSLLLYSGITYLFFIDPRIEIYLTWDKDGYGNSVSSFGSILFHITLLIVYFLVVGVKDFSSNIFLMLTVFGILFFMALSPTAIFAFRLSNLIWSFYPFLIFQILDECRNRYLKPVSYVVSFFIILVTIIFLISRPGSFEIIQSIQF
jgi:hypothetical protein